MQQHKTSDNLSVQSKTIKSKLFFKNLHPREPPTTPCGRQRKNLKRITHPSPPLWTHLCIWTNSNFDKAHAFAHHLSEIFQPHSSENLPADDEAFIQLPKPLSTGTPVPRFRCTNIQTIVNSLNSKNSSGYDLIIFLTLKSLLPIGIKYLTQLFNSALVLVYFPNQWKVAKIILLLKPGKPPHELQSYRPISLLPVVSKVFEKILLHRIFPLVASNSLIPDHHFGFRKRQSTIDQTHRIVQRIHTALDSKQYCSAAFLDISQAFDKVWHAGLLYKLRQALPLNYFLL
jgi:hypothetical protein